MRAYFIKSQFQPQFELDDATKLASIIDVKLIIGNVDALSGPDVAINTHDRCYFCKKAILSKLWELALADGISVLCDGANADDDETDRPGMRATHEQGVISPLRDCGLTKADVRKLSKEAGLFTHDKPSYACLATRIPTGMAITEDMLKKVENAENALFGMGFSNFRVRVVPPNTAKLQLPSSGWDLLPKHRDNVLEALKQHFDDVVIDMAIR